MGRIVEVRGAPGGGKTTMALQAIAACQKVGGQAAFIDLERSFDPRYAKAIGVDLDSLLLIKPLGMEETFEILDSLIKSNSVRIIAMDSEAALVPGDSFEKQISAQERVASRALFLSQKIPIITARVEIHKCLLFLINQLRDTIATMGYGPRTTSPGGKAVKFYASVVVDVRPLSKIKKNDDTIIGHRVLLDVVKNKLARPHQPVEADLLYGTGLWRSAEILDAAVDAEIVSKAGAWYSMGGERLGQGRENTAAKLEANPTLLDGLEAKIRAKFYEDE